MSKKISIFIIGYLLLALTGCSSPTIELNGVIYDRSEFSNEALAFVVFSASLVKSRPFKEV